MQKHLNALLLVLLLAATASAQRVTAGRIFSGIGAPTANCVVGPPVTDVYIRLDTQQQYICTALPSTWAPITGGGGGSSVWGGIIGTITDQSDLAAALAAKQGLDGDLSVIANLSPNASDIMQYKAGAWANRSIAQFKVDAGQDNLDNTSDVNKPISTATNTALNLKANLASPILTGVVTFPTPFTLGATSVTTTGAELNWLVGVTSSVQNQLDAKVVGSGSSVDGAMGYAAGTSGQAITFGDILVTSGQNLYIPGTLNVGDGSQPTELKWFEENPGTDYRSWLTPSVLAATVRFRWTDGVPTAGQTFILSAPDAITRISEVTYGTVSGTPGGSTTQVQINVAGAFAGDAGMTYDTATDTLTVGTVITTGGGYTNFASQSDSTTTGDIWRNSDLLKYRASGVTRTLSFTVASGTSALATSAIASGVCASVVTTSATGTATTDPIWWGFNADPSGVTGYAPTVNGMLTILAYPSADNVNFKVCNNTSASVTPGAITLNWRVVR